MKQQSSLSPYNKIKRYIGSTLLFIGIFSTATVAGILILIMVPLSFNIAYKISTVWCWLVLWMAKIFCGVNYAVEGLEHINAGQPVIILSNHQSAWETLALRCFLPQQVVLLKRSLVLLPIWGWALGSLKSIVIDRESQTTALRTLLEKGKKAISEGLWVVIFPEGTRTAAGEVKKFSAGGALLAEKSGVPVIPVVHNAGDFWPRYSFLKYPGTIRVRIGPCIESQGRKAADINREAEQWIINGLREISL
jgi:1-acyl-sn-glycerol-3-phosphate acyltransferase